MVRVGSTNQGDELLPALAASLGREMRLDAVAIDVAGPGGWERAASYGVESPPPAGTGHRPRDPRSVHHDEIVGRLMVGLGRRRVAPARDELTLQELAAPLALAVSWVRLAADLRRSSLAVLSAREEERRRLRRDLHDGLGPALTGISLGLRTAIRQLERTDASRPDQACAAPGRRGRHDRREVKRIVRDLRPSALDELGLVGAVAEFAQSIDGAARSSTWSCPGQEPAPAGRRRGGRLPDRHRGADQRRAARRGGDAAGCGSTPATWSRSTWWTTASACPLARRRRRAGRHAGAGGRARRERDRLARTAPHGTHLHVRLPAVLP